MSKKKPQPKLLSDATLADVCDEFTRRGATLVIIEETVEAKGPVLNLSGNAPQTVAEDLIIRLAYDIGRKRGDIAQNVPPAPDAGPRQLPTLTPKRKQGGNGKGQQGPAGDGHSSGLS